MQVDMTWEEFGRLLSSALQWSSPSLVAPPEAPPAPQWWYVAPLVTGAAVVVAWWTAYRSLGIQRRALVDNRALRVQDDVREVLAETLRDLSALSRGINAALRLVEGRPHFRWLQRAERESHYTSGVSRATDQITAYEADAERARTSYEEALNGVVLQTERLELLLGRDHPLTRIVGVAKLHLLLNDLSDAWFIWLDEGDDLELAGKIKKADGQIVGLRERFREQARSYVEKTIDPEPPRPRWWRRLWRWVTRSGA